MLGNSLKFIISHSIQYSKYIFDVVGGPNLHYKKPANIRKTLFLAFVYVDFYSTSVSSSSVGSSASNPFKAHCMSVWAPGGVNTGVWAKATTGLKPPEPERPALCE